MKKLLTHIKHRRYIAKQHVERKLLIRLRIFAGIILIITGFIVRDIAMQHIGVGLALLGVALGLTIGLIAGRMFKIFWHTETQKVVSRLDRIGTIFLMLYIGVEVGKKWLFGYWLAGAELNAFGLVFLAGLLLGRLLTMASSVRKILKQENKM